MSRGQECRSAVLAVALAERQLADLAVEETPAVQAVGNERRSASQKEVSEGF